MSATSIRFLLINWWARGGSISANSARTDYEASKTANMALSKKWRANGAVAEWLLGDLGTVRKIGGVAILGTNLTTAATIRVRVGNDSTMASTLYDSGTVAFWERVYSASEITAGYISEFFNGSGLPVSDTERYIQEKVRVVYLPSEVTARYVRVDINDPTNPDGYVEVAYVYAGRVFEPNPDIFYGWKIARNEIARMPQATCGEYGSGAVIRRTNISCTVAAQRETSLLGEWFLIQYLTGNGGEFIVSVQRSQDSWKFFSTIYCKFAESPRNQNNAFRRFTIPMEIEEIVSL